MNKKYQSKLEDIEREIDSMKSKNTTNKRIKIMKEAGIEPKKRGRPVGSKKVYSLLDMENRYWEGHSAGMDDCESCHVDIDVPNMYEWKNGFDDGTVAGFESAASDFKRVNKITWVLTVVNVAILISLVIKNVWMK